MEHKAVVAIPDVGLSDSEVTELTEHFANHLTESFTRAGAKEVVVVVEIEFVGPSFPDR